MSDFASWPLACINGDRAIFTSVLRSLGLEMMYFELYDLYANM